MKLCVMMTLWKRPEVVKIAFAGLRRAADFLAHEGVQLQISAAISPEDDTEFPAFPIRGVCSAEHNVPLASKHNAVSLGAKWDDPDYTILVDSDDLLSNGFWMGVVLRMRAGVHYAGVRDFHVYDLATKRLGWWSGYLPGNPRHGEAIGLGKLFSRKLMETVDWKLWPDSDKLSGMDGLSHARLAAHGFKCDVTTSREWGGVALDLKSKVNMWSFNRLPLENSPYPVDLAGDFPELDGVL